jgi:GNAT superfamily N-acetyltransferase
MRDKGEARAKTWSRAFRNEQYVVSTDKDRLDLEMIHNFLSTQSYWAKGIPRTTLEESIRHSLCFGLFHGNEQIGFARIVSDLATIAYLADVFVVPQYRGRGLSKWLMECICSHPHLQDLRRWMLVTEDAHGLYRKYGFVPLARPERFMERHNPGAQNPAV